MSVTLEDNKRTAIAVKLADMEATQNLLIANDKALIEACPDREISNRLESFLKDDQKNLAIINTVIVQYGIKAEAKPTVRKMIEKATEAMGSSELSLFEKVAEHELIKHSQTMAGLLVHKAGQVVGADIAVAITPLNTVNFENRAHQEQLKGIMEVLSTKELTGQEADQGIWARVQDAVAAVTGIAGGFISHTDSEIGICDLIRLDHTKVAALFKQMQNTNDPQKLEECFGQVYKDLSAHAEAEEQVVYPAVQQYYNDMQKLYDEQAEMKRVLEQIKEMNPANTDQFKTAVVALMNAVNLHVEAEENDMFPRIKSNFSNEQEKRLATEFKACKSRIQDECLAAQSK
jgi:hemerythrin superfamily protein